MISDFAKIEEILYNLGGNSIGTVKFSKLLTKYDNPHLKYKTIHVVGTNGKGSTTSFLCDLLKENYNVGTFTSPAMLHLFDRIKLNGNEIDESEFCSIFNLIYNDIINYKLCFFDVMTLIMFIYFSRKSPDYVIVEAGIGSLSDCTSVIDPVCTLLTNVSFDHTELLGNSLEEICLDKIGALKKGSKLFCSETSIELRNLIVNYCDKNDCSVEFVDNIIDYDLKMKGAHQKYNSSLALMAYKFLDNSKLDYETILSNTYWKGRFDKIANNIYIDGAHNIAGISAAINTANEVFGKNNYTTIISVLRDKDLNSFLPIINASSKCILTTFDYSRAMSVEEINVYNKYIAYEDLIDSAINSTDNYLITGSLYFISDVLKYVDEGKKL